MLSQNNIILHAAKFWQKLACESTTLLSNLSPLITTYFMRYFCYENNSRLDWVIGLLNDWECADVHLLNLMMVQVTSPLSYLHRQ